MPGIMHARAASLKLVGVTRVLFKCVGSVGLWDVTPQLAFLIEGARKRGNI